MLSLKFRDMATEIKMRVREKTMKQFYYCSCIWISVIWLCLFPGLCHAAGCRLEDLTGSTLNSLVSNGLVAGSQGQAPMVTIAQTKIVCLATEYRYNTYREVSIVVMYDCSGPLCPGILKLQWHGITSRLTSKLAFTSVELYTGTSVIWSFVTGATFQ